MFAFDEITSLFGGNRLVPILSVFLVIALLALAVMVIRFRSQQHRLKLQSMTFGYAWFSEDFQA